MNFFNKFLTLWILIIMILGILFSFIPNISNILNSNLLKIGNYNIVLTFFLIFMLIPPFMKINFSDIKLAIKDYKILIYSFILNWLIGPFLMFGLAVGIIGEVDFRTGVIIIGLARCIAMVLVWNNLAGGNHEYCITIVIFNSILQIILFTFYLKWFTNDLPLAFNLQYITTNNELSISKVVETVSIYMFFPFILGIVIHYFIRIFKTENWYINNIHKKIDIIGSIGLLITIFLLFSMSGKKIYNHPFPIMKVAIVLLLYFIVMFFLTMGVSKLLKISFEIYTALSFTAASNNFELAIASAIGLFGYNSSEALAATIGPLLEVPVMLILVKICLLIKRRM